MRKVLYYWFVAMLEDVVMVKTRIVKYIVYKLNEMISATSAKTDPASDPSALRPDASDVFSASPASCAS